MSGAAFRVKADAEAERRAAGEFEVDRVVAGTVTGEADNGFYLVREDFPLDTRHGMFALGGALEAEAGHIAASAKDGDLAAFDPRRAVFIDTETTGLSGGTGTVTFLVGVGYFVDDAFRLDQCFMRDYDDEEPMLRYLDEVFGNADTVVSYNGKSFDVPLLRTRFIQNRVPFRLDAAGHYDLVHAARRIWKRRLRDCSLGNIERQVMGIRREGDVPSHEIPTRWLEYLRTRDARRLQPVFYHHKMDILSLAALTGHVSSCLAQPDGGGFDHSEDKVSLLRLYYGQARYDDVLGLADSVLRDIDDEVMLADCLEMLGFAAKRREAWERMEDAWRRLAELTPYRYEARHELAKYYEHRKRDLPAAERECVAALQYLDTRAELGRQPDPSARAAFERRLARIQGKLKRRA